VILERITGMDRRQPPDEQTATPTLSADYQRLPVIELHASNTFTEARLASTTLTVT